MIKLSTHFTRHELACPCCGLCSVSGHLVEALEALREACGNVPVTVTSGKRCTSWNERQGGVDKSQHLLGRAADVIVQGMEPEEVAQKAETIPGFRHGGIGVYDTFVHLDVRTGGPARWHG